MTARAKSPSAFLDVSTLPARKRGKATPKQGTVTLGKYKPHKAFVTRPTKILVKEVTKAPEGVIVLNDAARDDLLATLDNPPPLSAKLIAFANEYKLRRS